MRVNEVMIAGVVTLAGIVLWTSTATAARISDVTNTKHNFSATVTPQGGTEGASRTVRASSESEICVFCHTPHGADNSEGPLWNKTLPGGNPYTPYTSSSIDSNIGQVNGPSKLCLSCHDGTIAIGSVRNAPGSGGQNTTISMQGTSGGDMPVGEGVGTGYTRNLGQDLSNDHPISLTYNQSFVNADGEMRSPSQTPIRVRGQNPRPGIQDIHLTPVTPGSSTGQVQCISCHDPHIRETTDNNIKFLRFNKLQTANPNGSNTFLPSSDIICLACHTKAGWETSAHAQQDIANEAYTNPAANTRGFPTGTEVWESSCLACHDTHTVEGSRRLLRAGTDAGTFGSDFGYQIKSGGGDPAIEETCYACHSANGGNTVSPGDVPNIETDFLLPRRMPITNNDQGNATEVHDIVDADFIENPNNMGNGNRHVECTDCHNPHRVVKRQSYFNTNAGGAEDTPSQGTHAHVNNHTNIASGVLRGTWGVEPNYGGSTSFHVDPVSFAVKSGEPPGSANENDDENSAWVTREYQVCLKCHSNYAFNGGYNGPPTLGGAGLTPSGTNGMTRYTNIAREFNSPLSHAGEPVTTNDGGANYSTNNHRSWHPVMKPTQRSGADRNATDNLWLAPFRAVGTQTMYCTDCHGSNTGDQTVVPTGNNPWGPHGSTNNFILKGPWSGARTNGTGEGQPSHLCFKCHDYAQYADGTNNNALNSGFASDAAMGGGMMMDGGGGGGHGGGGGGGGGGMGCMGGGMACMGMMDGGTNNLHIFHANQVQNFRCNLCHVAVPHGWKNKNFLVNLNDVGPEAGLAIGTERRFTTATYTNGPYYNRAALKVVQFAESGLWNPDFCGSQASGVTGVNWMASGNEACNNVP